MWLLLCCCTFRVGRRQSQKQQQQLHLGAYFEPLHLQHPQQQQKRTSQPRSSDPARVSSIRLAELDRVATAAAAAADGDLHSMPTQEKEHKQQHLANCVGIQQPPIAGTGSSAAANADYVFGDGQYSRAASVSLASRVCGPALTHEGEDARPRKQQRRQGRKGSTSGRRHRNRCCIGVRCCAIV